MVLWFVCLLVYDVTSRDTYNHLLSWLTDARMLARPDITVVVVGNQMDRKDEREVTLLEASRFAQENGESHARLSHYGMHLYTYTLTSLNLTYILSFHIMTIFMYLCV